MRCYRAALVIALAVGIPEVACRPKVRVDDYEATVHLTVFEKGKAESKSVTTKVTLDPTREWLGCSCDSVIMVTFEANTLPDQTVRIGEVLPIRREQNNWQLKCEWSPPLRRDLRARYLGSGKIMGDRLEGTWDVFRLWKPEGEQHTYSASFTAKKISSRWRTVY